MADMQYKTQRYDKNGVIFSLIEEALFNKKSTPTEYPTDIDFWEEIYREMRQQAVITLPFCVISEHREIPQEYMYKWDQARRDTIQRYVQMYSVQSLAIELISNAQIPVAVIKGTAAACYYPVPEFRNMGDVDLLVRPRDYRRAIDILKDNGFRVVGEDGARYHTMLTKYKVVFELHQSPGDVKKDPHGDAIRKYVVSGLRSVEMNTLGPDAFPILPWKQNGMELLWHIKQHLYNGLGLRQIFDWMMFVNHWLDDDHFREYEKDLRICGLEKLAIHVTRMCQMHFGLREEGISWCCQADEVLCEELLAFIMEQGNFGHKRGKKDKISKVFSKYTNPVLFISQLQEIGTRDWKLLKKMPWLRPMAWMYACVWEFRNVTAQSRSPLRFAKEVMKGKRRARMLRKLYG